MTNEELVAAVKAYAIEHYTEDGWDYVVEAYSDAEIAEAIGACTTVKGALKKVAEEFGLKIKKDRDDEMSAFAANERAAALGEEYR